MTLRLSPLETGIPDELLALSPERAAEVIVVGESAYKMYPLTEQAVEEFSVDLMTVVGELLSAWKKIQDSTAVKDSDGAPIDPGGSIFKSGGKALMDSGFIRRLLARMTGLPEEQVQNDLTIPQIAHIASVVYKQNFDISRYPEVTRGKVYELLAFLGIGGRGTTAFAEDVMRICFDPTIEDRAGMLRAIFSSATRLLPSERWSQLRQRASAGLLTPSRVEGNSSAVSSEVIVVPTSPPAPSAESPAASTKPKPVIKKNP